VISPCAVTSRSSLRARRNRTKATLAATRDPAVTAIGKTWPRSAKSASRAAAPGCAAWAGSATLKAAEMSPARTICRPAGLGWAKSAALVSAAIRPAASVPPKVRTNHVTLPSPLFAEKDRPDTSCRSETKC
jgi:hypothetical protein